MNTTRPLDASSPELPLGLLASGACEDLDERASSCSLKTRIGPSAVFGETRTEPLAFLTSTSQRASAVSLPEVASDLFFFSQEDGAYSDVNFYSYVGGRPTEWRDPSGLRSCKNQIPKDLAEFRFQYDDWFRFPSLGLGQQDGAKYWGPFGNAAWICSGGKRGSSCTAWAAGLITTLAPHNTECCRAKEGQSWGWAGPLLPLWGLQMQKPTLWPWAHTVVDIECRCDTTSEEWKKADQFDPFWRLEVHNPLSVPSWPNIPWSPYAGAGGHGK